MADETRYNAVTFRRKPINDQVTSLRISLTLEGPWSYTAGPKPNTNRAIVSYLEFQKLTDVIDVPGDIEFWYTNSPGSRVPTTAGDTTPAKPDVTLSNWRIVDVQISRAGYTPDDPDNLKVTEYRLFFADFRERLILPRGSRLRLGLINKGPKPADGVGVRDVVNGILTVNGVPEMDLNDLVREAVAEIPILDPVVPPDLANVDAPRNVQWHGNHAPTELAKLLELGGAVLCPNFAAEGAGEWMGRVEMIKTAEELPVDIQSPDGALGIMPSVSLPIIDRRGKTVIFSSYPLPTAETITVNGPRDDQWYFVIQDSKGNWVKEADCDLLQPSGGGNPNGSESDGPLTLIQAWVQNFVRIKSSFRQQMSSQAFRFIKLGDGSNPPAGTDPSTVQKLPPSALMPILGKMIAQDGTYKDVQVVAQYARYDPSTNKFINSDGFEPVKATFKDDTNIIQLLSALVRVDPSPADDLHTYATTDGVQFTVTFTVPQIRQDSTGLWKPQYYHVGFRRKPVDESGQTLEQLSDDEIQTALDSGSNDPDLIFVARPELRLFVVGNIPVNEDALIAQAQTLADRLLANSADPTRVIKVRGFGSARIDGHVSGLEWTQRPAETTITVNDWYRPGGALDAVSLVEREAAILGGSADGGAAGNYPNQPSTQEPRIALGETGATQPMVPLSPHVVEAPVQACGGSDIESLSQGFFTPSNLGWQQGGVQGQGVSFPAVSSVQWDGTLLTFNFRTIQFDSCGKLMFVGGEQKVVIDTPVACA